jgi:hypothetical protein
MPGTKVKKKNIVKFWYFINSFWLFAKCWMESKALKFKICVIHSALKKIHKKDTTFVTDSHIFEENLEIELATQAYSPQGVERKVWIRTNCVASANRGDTSITALNQTSAKQWSRVQGTVAWDPFFVWFFNLDLAITCMDFKSYWSSSESFTTHTLWTRRQTANFETSRRSWYWDFAKHCLSHSNHPFTVSRCTEVHWFCIDMKSWHVQLHFQMRKDI